MPEISELRTTGGICEDLGEPFHRVRRVIHTRDIQHVATAGIAKLYDAAAIQAIRTALSEIDGRKTIRGGFLSHASRAAEIARDAEGRE